MLCTLGASAQTEAFPSYIQVNGAAQREVAPDEIHLSIVLKESDTKGRVPLLKQQNDLVAALGKLGLGKNLKLEERGAAFFRRGKDALAEARYDLTVSSSDELERAAAAIESISPSSMEVVKVTHTRLRALQNELKAEAVKDAQARAALLAGAVGQKAGRCVQILDYEMGEPAVVMYKASRMEVADQNESVPEFQTLHLRASVQTKFILE